ncbi:HigA family addiction module antitoxin [Curvibacter sp. PAE-UM]|uniref:HigA family addiction module antitoxin n=1 Tax=Curvibacter sp. PAE-UM TaxID=1714344 RepID=UPI000ABBE0D1|nr:HigA family addiction module antitoxin [Curvibacter sp. PAE-UM]
MTNMFNPAHPGEVLKEAYLDPLHMSVTEFARRIDISRKTASEFVNKRGGVSVEMAHRLAKATNTTAEFWLTMQVQYSLWEAKKAKMAEHIHVQRLDMALA